MKVGLTVAALLVTAVFALWFSMWLQVSEAEATAISVSLTSHSIEDEKAYAERPSETVRFKTVSSLVTTDNSQFEAFNKFLFSSYPKAMSVPKLVHQSEHSLLLSMEGKDSSLAPVLMISHSDVVPAQVKSFSPLPNFSNEQWKHPPFSGEVDESFIWGRGTLDNKSAILAIMEAIERRVKEEKPPRERTLYLAFTHDEEVGGRRGAKKLADFLKDQGIRPYFVLDEGQAVTQGVVPNVEQPVALIGVSQKGYVTLELLATGESGNSMMPPKATAISKLSEAIHLLTQSPMSPKMTGPVRAMFKKLSSHMAFPQNVALYHTWLTEPLISSQLSKQGATDALIRSSMSVNVVEGGVTENVLPKNATALVNYRIAPPGF